MSESIVTVSSDQPMVEEVQTEEIQPQEEGQEHIEQVEAEEPETEAQEESQDAPEEAESVSEEEEQPFDEVTQKRLGAILSAERRNSKAVIEDLKREINSLKAGVAPQYAPQVDMSQYQQNGQVHDPLTGQWYPADSAMGAMVLREQLKVQREQQLKQMEVAQKEAEQYERLEERIVEAHARYTSFDESVAAVSQIGHPEVAKAFANVDNPDAIINYLGKNPKELSRLSQLNPTQRAKEIYKLEDRFKPQRKLATKAPTPVKTVNSTRNTGAAVENKSIDSLAAYYKERYYGGRK
jgi:hypothetical protein